MPELPELVNFKKYVDSTSLHQKIDVVEVLNEQVLDKSTNAKDLQSTFRKKQFESSTTHGKYLFLQTDNRHELVMHFGMTGQPVYYQKEDEKPEYPRMIIHFENAYHLAFDCMRILGKINLIQNHEKFIQEKDLGPDALKDVQDPEKFGELLDQKRGMIKSALMDQSLMAGIGNECSDEILFQACIHPKKNVQELSEKQLSLLFEKMHKVLQTKIDAGTGTEHLPDSYILKNRSEGAECPQCGGTVKQIKVSGRNGYYCPDCQSQ